MNSQMLMKPGNAGCGAGASIELVEVADALKALGHPARLAMISQLIERDRCCGNDFCACLPLAQSTVSQHLDMLISVGLVERKPEGNRSIFTLNSDRLEEIAQYLRVLASQSGKPKGGN